MKIFNNRYNKNNFTTIFKITLISSMISIITILRYILIFLPNVELVTFLLMLSVLVFTFGISFSIINFFCLIQIILFGLVDIPYFYIFNLYGLIVLIFKKILINNKFLFTLLIFVFGLSFGFLYALEYFILYGFTAAIAYWISGLIFDLIHAIGNSIVSIILFNFIIDFFIIISDRKPFIFNNIFLFLKEKN